MKSNKEIILSILIVFSVLLLVVFMLWFMFGNSPTLEQMLMILVLPVYLFVLGVYERLNNKVTNLNNKIMDTRESLGRQMGEIKVSLAKIESKLKS